MSVVVDFKAKPRESGHPFLQKLDPAIKQFDAARQAMLAAWADLANSGALSQQLLTAEVSATQDAMDSIRELTAPAGRE